MGKARLTCSVHCRAVALALTIFCSTVAAGRAAEVLEVTRDTVLDPERTYGQIVVKTSGVTIDGRGAWLVGAESGEASKFSGEAIVARGMSNVTLKNVRAKGWETGLHVVDGDGWTIEGCDFSDNFHDPAFGWGENGRRGGIVLERVARSTVRDCKANRVWDACVLVGSHGNVIERCDFSRTSNTSLKLWNACRNVVRENNLSYGLRIDPGEVHARDSTCVLIESGSNDNRFTGNDCTHGGDGIFVRVLNQWVSTGNVFERNDCSYANNNCIEAWSPRNVWIGNKANHGSYGFWLGASDGNVLVDNEASYNGRPDGFHNSPHLPGERHAGIVFMFGTSSHTIVRRNVCEGNNGAGIAAIGDLDTKGEKWRAFHWIIEQNTLRDNVWAIYLQHAEMIDLAANEFEGNSASDIEQVENVRDLVVREGVADAVAPPRAKMDGPDVVRVGDEARFDASGSSDPAGRALEYRWHVAGGGAGTTPSVRYAFTAPGFYRVALTVNNGALSDLAWRHVYAVEAVDELATGDSADAWSWSDPQSQVKFAADADVRLVGNDSVRATVNPYSGGRVTLKFRLPEARVVSDFAELSFWLAKRNENTPSWQNANPLVGLFDAAGQVMEFTPTSDLLNSPRHNEARDGWTYFAIPLAGNEEWTRSGVAVAEVVELQLGFDSWGGEPFAVWIDGLTLR
jgi:parallel beta-helix repeat protein